jgi:hypothetical protein
MRNHRECAGDLCWGFFPETIAYFGLGIATTAAHTTRNPICWGMQQRWWIHVWGEAMKKNTKTMKGVTDGCVGERKSCEATQSKIEIQARVEHHMLLSIWCSLQHAGSLFAHIFNLTKI